MPPRGKRTRLSQSDSRRGWILLAGLTVLLVAIIYWRATTWQGERATEEFAVDRKIPDPPQLRPSSFLNTTSQAQYVGSDKCGECHAYQLKTHLQSAHAHSFAVVDPAQEPPDATFDHVASRRRLQSYRAKGELRHAESLLLANGGELELHDKALKYVVGSGRSARTYLAEEGGFLVESPLSWYASPKAWRMSPGYDIPRHSSFRRHVDAECLYCHVGRVEAAATGPARLAFQELAIGCERCHGPGSLHVRQREAPESRLESGERLIVNPGRGLSRELSEAICQQCHLESTTSAQVRGRAREEFRPGLEWNDFVVNFTYQQTGGDMTVTGHVEQLHASKCYQKSNLTCTTCHNPHLVVPPSDLRGQHRTNCLKCHDGNACRAPAMRRTEQNDDCAACHMPQSPVEVPHLAFTHHRIGIHKAANLEKAVPASALRPVLDSRYLPELDTQRLLGLAYWRHHAEGDNKRLPIARQRAKELLNTAAQGGLYDASVAATLAGLALEENNATRAKAHAERALADAAISPRERVQASELLSAMYVQESRLPEATRLLDQLIQQRPHPQHWFLLGVCRQRQGDIDGAIEALQQVVAIDPTEPQSYHTLASLYALRGDTETARRLLERAKLIESNLPQGSDR